MNYLDGTGKWKQLPNSPSDCKEDFNISIQQMAGFASRSPTAIVSVLGTPMHSGRWQQFAIADARPQNITLVCADALADQIAFLDRGYVDGLVGQLPYEMGYQAVVELLNIKTGNMPSQEVIGTNVLVHLRVPLVLPKLVVNNNLIGNLMASSLRYREVYRDLHERSMVRLLRLYHDLSALFAKTWRINRIFKSKVGFGRVKITANDVIAPLALLLFSNTAVLLCWTLFDPLTYVRKPLEGTDGWNRVIATYGTCHSHHSAAYLIPLALMNVGVMLFANWQAFEARTIQSEFSESKYIAIAIASMLQAAFIGVPTLFTVRKSPEAYYLILTFMLFVISMAVLMLIFIPKIVIHQNFQRLSPAEQRQLIRESIRRSHSSFSMRQQQMMVAGGAQDLSVEFRNRRDAEGEHKDNEDGMLVVDAAHETNRTEAMSSSCTGRDDIGNEDTEAMSDAAFQLLPELTSLQEHENQVSITTPDARAHVDDQLLKPDV